MSESGRGVVHTGQKRQLLEAVVLNRKEREREEREERRGEKRAKGEVDSIIP